MTDAQAAAIAEACINQVNYHAAPIWNGTKSGTQVVTGGFSPVASTPTGYDVLTFFDDADQAGALGYHTEDPSGSVYAKVFVKDTLSQAGAQILSGANSVCSVASHETLEWWQDRNVDKWVLGPDGLLYALELCDPVEADWYPTTSKYAGSILSLSNFALPSFFDDTPPAGAKFDYMGKLTKPFSLTSGGYIVYASFDPNSVQQKFGSLRNATVHRIANGLTLVAHFGASYPLWKKATKLHELSRTARRLAKKIG